MVESLSLSFLLYSLLFAGPDVEATWNSGNLKTGNSLGGTSNGNLTFELYRMKVATGFSQHDINHYINMCKRNGLLPVGCGNRSYNCDKNRYNGEPCVPMPEAWHCNMMTELRDNTGWGNNIVAFLSDSQHSDSLYSVGRYPSGSDNLHAVCGKVIGMFHSP